MLIRILQSPYSKGHTANINGRKIAIPPVGGEGEFPDEFLAALGDSNILYEKVEAKAETGAEEAPGGNVGEPSARTDEPDDGAADEETDEERAERERIEAEKTTGEAAELAARMELLKLLDLSVPKIIEKLDDLSPAHIGCLLVAEKAGKDRSTLISALDERLNPPEQE